MCWCKDLDIKLLLEIIFINDICIFNVKNSIDIFITIKHEKSSTCLARVYPTIEKYDQK
jgi:hypothetical protein